MSITPLSPFLISESRLNFEAQFTNTDIIATMRLNDGATLQNGKYRIIRLLGQGGFGITYLAQNTLLDRYVAIKEFFPKDFCGRDNTSRLTLGTQNNAAVTYRT